MDMPCVLLPTPTLLTMGPVGKEEETERPIVEILVREIAKAAETQCVVADNLL